MTERATNEDILAAMDELFEALGTANAAAACAARREVILSLGDWRKIRRVLRAAEVIRQRGAPGKGWDELRDAIDALNREPKK